MKKIFKKIILGIFLLSLVLIGENTVAQSTPISNITIDIVQKKLTGYINQSIPGAEIALYFENLNTGEGSEIDTLEWKVGDFETSIQNFTITPPTISEAGITFTSLHIQPSEGTGSYIDLSQLLAGGGGQTGDVTVDFPGWASSENLPGWEVGNYCKKADKEEYYPCLQSSGSITRTPASAPLHMILRASSTGEKKLLKTYPGGASSFNISALSPEEANGYGSLNADTIYEVFFASDEAGNNLVNYGSSTNPLKSLGKIPAPTDNAVSVTKAEIKTTTAGKKYFEVSGVVNKKVKDTMINVIVRKATATSGGELIGQIPYSQGSIFTVPSAQTIENLVSLEDGSYNLIFSRTVPPGIPEDFQTYSLPVVGAGTGTGTGGGSGNGNSGTGGGGINPYISPDQQKILDEGIVPVDCGSSYTDPTTGKLKHKLCGFPQLIELIDRAIKYIFVLMLPIAAIVFAYAGFLFLTSGGNVDRRKAAKRAMTNVIVGIIIILAAFLIVRTILLALGVQPADWVFLNI